MRAVIADTGPIHYLVLIGQIEILFILFEKVIIPAEVRDELVAAAAPEAVRSWIQAAPAWLEVHSLENGPIDPAWASLDVGERVRRLWLHRWQPN